MKVELKIDKYCLSKKRNKGNVFYQSDKIPGFKPRKRIVTQSDLEILIKETKQWGLIYYKYIWKYFNEETGNLLIICNGRKKKGSPIYLIFYPHYPNKLTYNEVIAVEEYFKGIGASLRPSVVHLALDLISKSNNLYDIVKMAIKPGTKGKPLDGEPFKDYDTSLYFGKPKCANQLVVYDKTRQLLEDKGVKIPDNLCRVEFRIKVPLMENFIRSTDELAHYDWSSIYNRFYSFHHRTYELKKELKAIGESWRHPIWELKDIAVNKLHVQSNFYRDYLIDHPQLTPLVQRVLAEYRWIND